jgi:predicted SprT family Zn-dependent metalloprotease
VILPKTLKIGGFTWKVKRSQPVTTEGNCFGSTHFRAQEIYIEPDSIITQQKSEQCLLHELLHVIIWQTGLAMRLNDNKLEEELVDAISHGLYQVLKDNKLTF